MAHSSSSLFVSNTRISIRGSNDDLISAHDQGDHFKLTESFFQEISIKILKIQKQSVPISTSNKFTESQVSSSSEAKNPLKNEFAAIYKIPEYPSNNQQELTSQPESFSNDFNLSDTFKINVSINGRDKMFILFDEDLSQELSEIKNVQDPFFHQVSEFAKSNLLFMKTEYNSFEILCQKEQNEPQAYFQIPSLQKKTGKKIKWVKLKSSQPTGQEEQKSNNKNSFTWKFSNNYNYNLDIKSPQKNEPQIVNQPQIENSSDLNQHVNQDNQDKKIESCFQEIQNKNINELPSKQIFDITNSKQRSKLLISVTDYANKQFKSQQLITTFTLLQKNEGFQFIADFHSLRKDKNSFYRAVMVSFLSQIFEKKNNKLFLQNFLNDQMHSSCKRLTSRSKQFPSASEEELKNHFIFRFRERIEENFKSNSSPRNVATLIIDMVSRDQFFDASCLLISRNLSLKAFELICDNPSYSSYFGEGDKASVQLEFLKGDQEPSELAKTAIAQAFNMTINQENIFYDQKKQHINHQINTYSPVQIDQSRQKISCNVINHEAQYILAFSACYK